MAFEGRNSSSGARLMSALIVECNYCIRNLHALLFRRREFETYAVTNGEEAMDIVYLSKKFDIIIMGMTFPITEGVQVRF